MNFVYMALAELSICDKYHYTYFARLPFSLVCCYCQEEEREADVLVEQEVGEE